MRYKYNDFVKAAQDSGMMDKFSEEDLITAQRNPEYGLSLLSLEKDRANAKTAEQRMLTDEAENQLRKNYGSSGKGHGSGSFGGNASVGTGTGGSVSSGTDSGFNSSYAGQINQTMDQLKNYGDFVFSQEDAYKELQDKIANQDPFTYSKEEAYQKLLDSILNPEAFSYDPNTDPRMSAYKKAFLREGDRAIANTLAKVAASSGGVPSSYAVSAAQQAGNYYAGQLADIIPQLYQDSYNQYVNDQNLKLNGLGAMQSDRSYENQQYMNQYNMLQNLLGNMQTDRNFENQQYMNQYNMLQNMLGNLQNQESFQYNQYIDALNQAFQKEQFEYQQQQDAWNQAFAQQQLEESRRQQEYANALALYQATGILTSDIKNMLGLSAANVPASLSDSQIRQVQSALGVTVDGYVGPETMGALNGLTPEEYYALNFGW